MEFVCNYKKHRIHRLYTCCISNRKKRCFLLFERIFDIAQITKICCYWSVWGICCVCISFWRETASLEKKFTVYPYTYLDTSDRHVTRYRNGRVISAPSNIGSPTATVPEYFNFQFTRELFTFLVFYVHFIHTKKLLYMIFVVFNYIYYIYVYVSFQSLKYF